RDPQFDADVEGTQEGFGDHLETVAYERAVNGWDRPIYQRGELVGHERVYDSRILSQLLEANNKRYKKDDGTKVAVVVQPLSGAELMNLRDLGREKMDELDALAKEMAEVERERDEERQAGKGG